MANLGTAYIKIAPDLSGVQGKISSELSGAVGDAGATAAKSFSGGFSKNLGQLNQSFGAVADGLGKILKAGISLAAGGTFGIGAMAKASWNQVDAVQQAVAGLNRYYDSSKEVEGITKSLIKYAQSDMGVLFNRKDLFNSAQGLAMFGIESNKVSGYVEILSRGMASNRLSWDELDGVIGRVIATGRLSGQEFEMLRKAGYNLDDSLRNTTISTEELFEALDNSIAKDISQDLSNITPVGVRLASAFRGLGDAFLGVNETGDKFVKGGAGQAINKMLMEMTEFLRTPEMKEGIANLGRQFGEFLDKATPVIQTVLGWIVNNIDIVIAGVKGLGIAFSVAKIGQYLTGIALAMKGNPFTIWITAISLLLGLLLGVGPSLANIDFGAVTARIQAFAASLPGFIANVLPQMIQKGVEIITNLITGITKALPSIITSATQIITALLTSIVKLLPMLLTAGLQIITGIITAITENIGLIISAALTIVTGLMDAIIEVLPMLIEAAIQILTSLIQAITENLSLIIEAALGIVVALVDGVIKNLPKIIKMAVELVETILDTITTNLPMIIEAAIEIVTTLIDTLIDNLDMIIETIITLIETILTAIIDNLPLIIEGALRIIVALVGALLKNLPMLVSAAIKLIIGIAGALIGAIPKIISAGWDLIVGLAKAVWDKRNDVWNKIKQIAKDMVQKVKDINWVQLGKDIVAGIANGLSPGKVVEKMKSIASSAMDAVKSFLGIKSPSRVMRDEVGKMLGAGLADGIEASTKNAVKSAASSARSVLEAYSDMSVAAPKLSADYSVDSELSGSNFTPAAHSQKPAIINLHVGSKQIASQLIDDINDMSFLNGRGVINI